MIKIQNAVYAVIEGDNLLHNFKVEILIMLHSI